MYKNKAKKNKKKEESIQTTIRLYKKDVENFKKYSKSITGLTQKDCFREMLKIWSEVRENEENGIIRSFDTYIVNEFNPKRSIPKKIFSICGSFICGFNETDVEMKLNSGNQYEVWSYNPNISMQTRREYEREKIKKWCKAVNEEFEIYLEIDADMSNGGIYNAPKYKYTYGINMFWDLKRKKYLIEDIFGIKRITIEDIHRPGAIGKQENTRQIYSKRYFYISSVKELKEKFNDDKYLLFSDDKKEVFYQRIETQMIPSNHLEEELEKYYIK